MQGEKKYCYDYPRPSYTADCMIFKKISDDFKILLIKRGHDPFKNFWAFPGGFTDVGETSYDAAKRELKEETGLSVNRLTEFHTFDKPGRDPRGWTVTVVYFGFSENNATLVKAGDDAADVKWFSVKELPDLAFDHREIIERALKELPELNELK